MSVQSNKPNKEYTVEPANYGGQAVIEGVMMRSRQQVAVAVRKPDGTIAVNRWAVGGFFASKWARMPFIRGLWSLWDSLGTGMKALTWSADTAAGEEVNLSGPVMWGTVAFSLALGLGLFFLLPALAAAAIDSLITSDWLSNFIEGFIRLAIFIAYLTAISRIPDIKRVFAYHGAEHKTINCYEAGDDLTEANIARYSTAHPRCGTGFLLIVVIVSIFVFGFLGRPPMLLRLASRLILVPVIAAISYELMRFAAKNRNNLFGRVMIAPSLFLQKLTTREPSNDMLEVAKTALTNAMPEAAETETARADTAPMVNTQ